MSFHTLKRLVITSDMFIKRKDYKRMGELLIESTEQVAKQLSEIIRLEKELKEAKDMKEILEKMSDKITSVGQGGLVYIDNFEEAVSELISVDLVTGKDIFTNNSIKAIKIDMNGNIEKGNTTEAPDKGYSYKLVRE